ncbi:flavodoxin family protein [Methylobacillus glycogenes]|uniref:flavodoxin family protein n=1 Tax=Methylobacillus glycogenes TaxID=406 RepID=UPI000471D40E|nr:flavodoxin family protein [Methylobacillus glycogenes]
MSKIVVVYHSGYGHTEVQAKAVARGAAKVEGSEVKLLNVEEAQQQWDTLNAADAIIFGSPTYMGSASAQFKGFMDASSSIWYQRGWKDKVAAGFTTSASQSGDKLNTLIQLTVFAAQHGMIWVGNDLLPGNNSSTGSVNDLNRLGGFLGALAQANSDQGPDVAPLQSDLLTAEHLGERVALITKKLHA